MDKNELLEKLKIIYIEVQDGNAEDAQILLAELIRVLENEG